MAIQFLEKLIPSKTRGKLNDAGVLETKEKILNANTYSAFALQLDLLKASFDIDVIVRTMKKKQTWTNITKINKHKQY